MAAIILPQRHNTQPKGRVAIAPEFQSLVLSAAVGGQLWNAARGEIEHSVDVERGAGTGGASDKTTSATARVGEPSRPGDTWFTFCSFELHPGTAIHSLLGNDSSTSAGDIPRLRVFQFRQNGANFDHIRFNTSRSAYSTTIAHGIAGGAIANVGAWSRGSTYGIISNPAGETTGTIVGTPEPWNQVWTAEGGVANWYARRQGAGWNDPSNSNFFVRAVLSDPFDFEFRRDLLANPYQMFRADPVRIYSLAAATIPTLSLPGVTDITATSARPQVTLTY